MTTMLSTQQIYNELLAAEGLVLLARERGPESHANIIATLRERLLNIIDNLPDIDDATIPAAEIENTENPENPKISEIIDDAALSPLGDKAISPFSDKQEEESDEIEATLEKEEIDEVEVPLEEDEDRQDFDEPLEDEDSQDFDEPLEDEEEEHEQKSPVSKLRLTLNDRFRFRRELFGNSNADLDDAINLVEAMRSLSEAEEYFYADLGWDRENEEVQAFMDLIRQYFTGQPY